MIHITICRILLLTFLIVYQKFNFLLLVCVYHFIQPGSRYVHLLIKVQTWMDKYINKEWTNTSIHTKWTHFYSATVTLFSVMRDFFDCFYILFARIYFISFLFYLWASKVIWSQSFFLIYHYSWTWGMY